MHLIPYFIRDGRYHRAAGDFVSNNMKSLQTNRRHIWRLRGANGNLAEYHHVVIPSPPVANTQNQDCFQAGPAWNNGWYSQVARGLATALRDAALFSVFGVKVTKLRDGRQIEIRNLYRDKGQTLLIPQIPAAPNDFWNDLREIIQSDTRVVKRVVFRGGGNVKIPDWFREWCAQNDVEIELIAPDKFDDDWGDQERPITSDSDLDREEARPVHR